MFEQYLEHEKQAASLMARRIASQPVIFSGMKNFHRMSVEDGVNFLQSLTRECADAMDVGLIGLNNFSKAPQIKDGMSHSTNGSTKHNWVQPNVYVNIHPEVFARSLGSHIDTIAHELTHQKQFKLKSNASTFSSKFRQSVQDAFVANFKDYKDPDKDYQAYLDQPVERHARLVGGVVSMVLTDFAAKHKTIPSPYDAKAVETEYFNALDKNSPISIGHTNRGQDPDPNRHYYHGLFYLNAEKERGAPINKNSALYTAISHFNISARNGEYLHGHDTVRPLDGLYQIASTHSVTVQGRSHQIAPHVREQARKAIEFFVGSDNPNMQRTAKRYISQLDKHAMDMAQNVGSEKRTGQDSTARGAPIFIDAMVGQPGRAVSMKLDVSGEIEGLRESLSLHGFNVAKWNKKTLSFVSETAHEIYKIAGMGDKFPGVSDRTAAAMLSHERGKLPIENAVVMVLGDPSLVHEKLHDAGRIARAQMRVEIGRKPLSASYFQPGNMLEGVKLPMSTSRPRPGQSAGTGPS